MAEFDLTYEVVNRVGRLHINRPPVNAVRHRDLRAVQELLLELPEEDELAVVVSTAGNRTFIGGHEVSEFVDADPDDEPRRRDTYVKFLKSLYELTVPSVVAIDGPAVGAGAIVASLCDICIASRDAEFALAEIDLGIIGGYAPLRRVLPDGVVRYMVYTGEPIPCERAHQLGMVTVTDDQPRERALECARKIASKRPDAVRAARTFIRESQSEDPIEGYRRERDFVAELRQSPEAAQAARAFLDRDPDDE